MRKCLWIPSAIATSARGSFYGSRIALTDWLPFDDRLQQRGLLFVGPWVCDEVVLVWVGFDSARGRAGGIDAQRGGVLRGCGVCALGLLPGWHGRLIVREAGRGKEGKEIELDLDNQSRAQSLAWSVHQSFIARGTNSCVALHYYSPSC